MQRILFILAALVLPVLWGVLVNWAFDLMTGNDDDDDHIFPEYQI